MTIAIVILGPLCLALVGWILRARILRLVRCVRNWWYAERILREDALKYLLSCEMESDSPSLRGLAGQLNLTVDGAAALLSRLQDNDLVRIGEGNFQLTRAGRDYASHVMRAHRILERYLADKTGVAEVEWHGRAEKLEHEISPEQLDALWAQLGHPTHDPHGDPVPTSQGSVGSLDGIPLPDVQPGEHGRVIHVEDEPESVYARLVELGIFPGMELRVLAVEPNRVKILVEGAEKQLGAFEAANVTLGPLREEGTDFSTTKRLSDLKPGEQGKVTLISRASRGIERRRLMDLGILPGTIISSELQSPGGDPTAYRIRGALLALRREQADQVLIADLEDGES